MAVKVLGTRFGPLVAGIAGGVVSSTITTIDLARRAKQTPRDARPFLAGALAASATMFARVAIIVAAFGPSLLAHVVGPLAAAFVVSVGAGLTLDAPWRRARTETGGEAAPLKNPFELGTVLLFAVMLAAMVLVSRLVTEMFGGGGGVAFSAVAGLSDVDAVTLSMTKLAGSTVSVATAALAILVAVSANSLSKSALALVTGPRQFGIGYLGVSLASLAAGGIVAFFEQWSF